MKRYPFGRFLLDIPDDHKIVEIHKAAVFYDRAFGFILDEISRASPEGTFLDIGGNIGDTAAMFATFASNRIVSVEGSSDFTGYFRSNLRHFNGQVSLIDKFVRVEALACRDLAFTPDSGSGYLSETGPVPIGSERFISVDELLREIGPLSLVKSDTDGMDGYIISEVIEKVPDAPLFFECDLNYTFPGAVNPWPDLFLRLNNYSVVVFDNLGLPLAVLGRDSGQLIQDLCGYAHLQHSVHPIRVHYLDIWAFPQGSQRIFDAVAKYLRSDLLKPHAF